MFPELPDAKIDIRNPIAAPSGLNHRRTFGARSAHRANSLTAPNFPHHRIAANPGQRRNSENVEIVTLPAFATNDLVRARLQPSRVARRSEGFSP